MVASSGERALAEREMLASLSERERERSQLITKIAMLCGYIGILIGELRVQRMSMPPAPYIPSKDPLI